MRPEVTQHELGLSVVISWRGLTRVLRLCGRPPGRDWLAGWPQARTVVMGLIVGVLVRAHLGVYACCSAGSCHRRLALSRIPHQDQRQRTKMNIPAGQTGRDDLTARVLRFVRTTACVPSAAHTSWFQGRPLVRRAQPGRHRTPDRRPGAPRPETTRTRHFSRPRLRVRVGDLPAP